MSTALSYLQTGRGKLGIRLSVEGLGYEFVSAPVLEGTTSDGRQRVGGLSHDGIGWREVANILAGTLDVKGFTCRIVDRLSDAAITKALAWQPTVKTWLGGDADTSDTVLSVLSSAGFAVDDVIHLGTEAMIITDIPDPEEIEVERAYWGTIAQSHYTTDGDKLARPVITRDRPMSVEGRRCNVYGYGPGDDPTGDGLIMFRGKCATDAALSPNGADWSITVDSIASLLDAPMGGELDGDVGSRGIYYSWSAPLTVIIQEGLAAATSAQVTIPSVAHPTAFFETQDEFTAYLTAAIDTEAGGFTTWDASRVVAVSGGAGDWWLEATLGGAAEALLVLAFSAIDGRVDQWFTPGGEATGGRAANTTYQIKSIGDGGHDGVPASIHRRVPRGMYGTGTVTAAPPGASSDTQPGRIYLGGTIDVSGLTAVRIEGTNGESSYVVILDQSASERWVQLGYSLDGLSVGSFGYGLGDDIKLRFVRSLGTGDVSVIRDAFVADSPDLANIGGLPFLTSDDLASWTAVAAEAARGRQWAAERRYIVDEETSAADYLAEEFKAVGVFPIIDSDGKIAIARMTAPASTEPAVYDIGAADIATDSGFPTWERNAWGRVNQIAYSWGYSPAEEEHRGTIVVRDVQAFSESKTGNGIEVAPKSEPVYGEPSYGDLVGLAWPYLGIFGRAYALVRLDGPAAIYRDSGGLGSVVTVTVQNVPNQTTGERGISAVSGIVVERGLDVAAGRASLGVLVLGVAVSGYAPTLQIDSSVSDGGGLYTLTVSDANPLDATLPLTIDDVADHWHVGDGVALSEAAATTAPITGTVTSIGSSTIQVSLGSAPGARDLLHYDDATAATADQVAYAFQATTAGRITFSTVEQAKEYAP